MVFVVSLQSILKKLHSESVRVLSLSDIQFLRGLEQRHFDLAKAEAAWRDEKASLLAAIQALKQLLSDTNLTTDASQVLLLFSLLWICFFSRLLCVLQ